MRAVVYTRSSKDRADISLAAQLRELRDLAAARGLTVVRTFEDAAVIVQAVEFFTGTPCLSRIVRPCPGWREGEMLEIRFEAAGYSAGPAGP